MGGAGVLQLAKVEAAFEIYITVFQTNMSLFQREDLTKYKCAQGKCLVLWGSGVERGKRGRRESDSLKLSEEWKGEEFDSP